MRDDEWKSWAQQNSPYVEDQGFTDQVMQKLPPPQPVRAKLLSLTWVLAISLSFLLMSQGQNWRSLSQGIWLNAVGLGFWALIFFLFYIAGDEGVFES